MANAITIGRLLLVPAFITAVIYGDQLAAPDRAHLIPLSIFILACLSDALDGIVARLRHEQTALGRMLDPAADKLLLLSGFLTVSFSPLITHKPPVWIVILVVSRDVFIALGILMLYLASGRIHIQPTFLGKMTTFSQMVTVCTVLLDASIAPYLWNLTALLTLVSGAGYLLREMKRDYSRVA